MSLVLTRRPGESVMIGDDIVVTVSKVKGNHVHLAFTAPKSIPIHRHEIYDAIQREQREGARNGTQPVV